MVKMVLVAFLFAASTFAQSSNSACGPENVHFDIRLDNSHSSLPKAEPQKALVFFIQDLDAPKLGLGMHLNGRVGIDGSWTGALKDNSYFSVFLDPGEHHICVNTDSKIFGHSAEFAHLTAEAGKVYYFRSRYLADTTVFFLAPTDSDEAKYLIANFPLRHRVTIN